MKGYQYKPALSENVFCTTTISSEAHKNAFKFLERNTPTEYDKIMDAIYNETNIGGGTHRSFDGTHTLVGSYDAITEKTGDVQAWEYFKAHVNECVTAEGIPFLTLDHAEHDRLATEISEMTGQCISKGEVKNLFRDANSLNLGEVLVGGVGALFLHFAFRSNDHRAISRVVAANLCLGITTGNIVQILVGLTGLGLGLKRGKIDSWELLKGSATAISSLIGYQVGQKALDLGRNGSLLVAAVSGITTAALIAHIDKRNRDKISEELGEKPSYVVAMTPALVQIELAILSARRPSLSIAL